MSALLHIKNLIMSRLEAEPDLKAAIMDVMNAIDSDLDDAGYETSFDTDEAIINLDKVLTGQDEDEDDSDIIIDAEVLDDTTEALLEDLEKDQQEVDDDDDDEDEDDGKV